VKKNEKYYLRTNLNQPVYIRITPTDDSVEITDQPEKTRHYRRRSVVLRSMLLSPAQRDKAMAKEKSDEARRRRWKQEVYDDGFTQRASAKRDGDVCPFDGEGFDDE
jgi:hypothetical protein